jgi:hypothetical protein
MGMPQHAQVEPELSYRIACAGLIEALIDDLCKRDAAMLSLTMAGAALARRDPADETAYSEALVFDAIGELLAPDHFYVSFQAPLRALLHPSCEALQIAALADTMERHLQRIEQRADQVCAVAFAGCALADLEGEGRCLHEHAVFRSIQHALQDVSIGTMIREQLTLLQRLAPVEPALA